MNTGIVRFFGISGGLFAIFCAWRDYDWFMNNNRAWLFVKLFGRDGARIFYIVLGIFLIVGSLFIPFE